MRSPRGLRRTGVAAVLVAVTAAGCGLGQQPVVSSADEVTAALAALAEQSMRASVSASIEVDEGELRALLREDDDLLAIIADGLDLGDEPADVDELIGQLRDAQDDAARWRVLLATGDDESWQVAVETDDTVWFDLRARSTLDTAAVTAGDTAALFEPFELDVQAMLDLDALGDVAASYGEDAGDLDVDEARTALDELRVTGLLGPDGAALLDLADAFLAGGLVEIGGVLDVRAWVDSVAGALGATQEDVEELIEESTGTADVDDLAIDLEGFVDAALSFDDYRTEDALTVVDVTIELRSGLEFLAATYDELAAGEDAGVDAALVEELVADVEAALEDLPIDTLDDVGELRFGPDGVLQQARLDVLGVVLDVAAATEEDADLATIAEAHASLERTGVFLTIDIADVGAVPTTLGAPDAAVTWDDLRGVLETQLAGFGPLLGGGSFGGAGLGLGDLDDGLGGDVGDGTDGGPGGIGLPEVGAGLSPGELAVGDCFDDEVLFGTGPGDAATVPCSEPHDNEVFAVVELAPPGTPYEPRLADTADGACNAAFEPYVGTPYFESVFFYGYIAPTQAQWDAGETSIACYLYSFDDETGSAAGSGR